MLGSFSTHQHFLDTNLIDSSQNVVGFKVWSDRFTINLIHLNHLDFRRQDETTINQFRCRNPRNHLTIDITIIHAWFVDSDRSLTGSSEIVATICPLAEILSSREKVTFHGVMCLIKVYGIHSNICVHDTTQRIVGSEDDNMLTHCLTHINKHFDTLRFSGAEMFGLTTMNMQHICISDVLKILRRELLSKKNTRSNYNNCARHVDTEPFLCVHDTDKSLAATSRKNALTDRISVQRI